MSSLVFSQPSQCTEKDLEWDLLGSTTKDFLEALQIVSKVSADNELEALKLLESKISNNTISAALHQRVTDIITSRLRIMEPEGELEEMFTSVLVALGSSCPGIIMASLWSKQYSGRLPPRTLLLAVGKLILQSGTAMYIGATWAYVLRLLRRTQEAEKEMLVLCQVVSGLATSARKHLDMGSVGEHAMDIASNELAIKAYLTLRVLFNRWPLVTKSRVAEKVLVITSHLFFLIPPSKLKKQVNWLMRRLTTLALTDLRSFYISQCICQMLDAIAVSGYGGENLKLQLETIASLLFQVLSEKVIQSEPLSVQSHTSALRAFYLLSKLYRDPLFEMLQERMKAEDPEAVVSTLEVFKEVFHGVPQTEELKRDMMDSIVMVVQEDRKPVRTALLNFLEMLSHLEYLNLPKGNIIIKYLIKLSGSEPVNEEAIRNQCFKILQTVPLPKLMTLVCEPSNASAFVVLCESATEVALKARAQGKSPYLSSFQLTPSEFVSPQKLLTHLVLCAQQPYREKVFGISSLRLLYALHPITSLHPVVNAGVGQLWMKEIPQMLKILEEHTEKTLNQEQWEARLLQFSNQSLAAINDDRWLEQLSMSVLDRIVGNQDNQDKQEQKAFLYKFFGFTLRTSRNSKLVQTMLSALLDTSHKELQEREGIAMALSIMSPRHLTTVLDQLQEYGTKLTDKDTSSILKLKKELQQKEWGLVCHTIYLSYSTMISERKGAISRHLDSILALVLQHYHNCIVEKDTTLKLAYLDALSHMTTILSNQPVYLPIRIPHKLDIVAFMGELIREEPLDCISSSIRRTAIKVVNDFRKFEPFLDTESRAHFLLTCYKGVFSLPSLEVLLEEAPDPAEGQAREELLKTTLLSLLRFLEAVVTEKPVHTQTCLELLETWLNSQKNHERERAMWCAARILGYTIKMNNFKMEIPFTHLGHLVRMLAVRCQDPVDNICYLSSQAVYSLYSILLLQKQMTRQNQNLWEEDGRGEVYSPNIFYNSTFKIGEAFAGYFTQLHLTNMVLKVMDDLTESKPRLSLAAAQLMSAVMKKRGKDMIKVKEIAEGILQRLNWNLEPNTKEETLQAMCALAGSNTCTVIPMLLSKPLPWDRITLTLWRKLGTERDTTINVLQWLIGILEMAHSTEETAEMDYQPVAVTCALCEMLSGALCQEAVQELLPRLLLAVLWHIYWVTQQNAPQKMVVYIQEGSSESKKNSFDSTGCALKVVKLVLLAGSYEGVVVYASDYNCWERLSSPKSYYIGIMDLTSAMVKMCDPSILHRILNHVKNSLYSLDEGRKILTRAFYAQLLWHRSIAQTEGQDFLGILTQWLKDPDHVMQEVGLRGISNLALHQGNSEALKSLIPSLRGFLTADVRVTVQAVKCLRNIIYHWQGEDIKAIFCSICPHLRPLINDARDLVRIVATSALGHMLKGVIKYKPGATMKKELHKFLLPLLLSIQDNNTEVVKACRGALTEWVKVIDWSSLTHTYQHTTLSDHLQVIEETCKYLAYPGKHQILGELLSQSFMFLKSPQTFLRIASVTFIGFTIRKMNMRYVFEEDLQVIRNGEYGLVPGFCITQMGGMG
ncbi:maestro heat-like repeat-containing protein family member 1 [Otolemur garnettii]|uniref:maestro heat-like repeat-containing protein family member 1 n=1 Tax=Otolemur garnettii TaxID=30611 RepID=UPI000C7EDDC0|nr:maestro heat-like repeat-containing protein family member 1 [Otolemur garnettii]